MARKAWAMLAVVSGGLTLSVITASLSNTAEATGRAAVTPEEVDRLRAIIDGNNADIAAMSEKLRAMELELQELRARHGEPGEREHAPAPPPDGG